MKKSSKSLFFIVVVFIAIISYLSFFGLVTVNEDGTTTTHINGAQNIRWGIDIRGGVDVTFSPPEGYDAPDNEMDMAQSIIETRLINLGITDSEVYTDYNSDRIIVRFPWKSDEENFDPEAAIAELGSVANLTFRPGYDVDENGAPINATANTVILEGMDISAAYPSSDPSTGQYVVSLELDEIGTEKFAVATTALQGNIISIWMDDTMISAPMVNDPITDGRAVISGNFTAETATQLAESINAGALPFKLETENFNTISPTLGLGARDAMVTAGVIAFIVIGIYMIAFYRLPGFVAMIALVGQVSLMIAALTGFFPVFSGFTLTLPGIAGIILSIGFGVDANIITAERIREEIAAGKSVSEAVSVGFKRAFSAILDGNVTVIIVAIILMGAFGPSTDVAARLLSPLFSWFGPSTAGAIYSFGFTLLSGVILNLLMGVLASRLMMTSLASQAAFKNPSLYGSKKAVETK